ncbi:MAG: UDP-glucose 4-epimerase GalE [Flavobacteriales bacterium]|nr:UDP-glucose 4-epimerase GalE [Flavobacteriales bacterium]
MEDSTIIVTGGAGYIGSHTIIELMERTPFKVLSLDNHANSSPRTYSRIEAISGRRVRSIQVDLCDREATLRAVAEAGQVKGIIHFAAFKSVPESVREPGLYYRNNIVSLLNVLEAAGAYRVPHFIFSSSCSVYGNLAELPVREDSPLGQPESPYAHTKQVGERIVQAHADVMPELNAISLRYFNPVGAHRSGLLGEDPINPPTNLVPVIMRVAVGRMPEVVVHGGDYDTRDGSCIRDYVHVSDIATAHVKALEHSMRAPMAPNHAIFNLGTGQGVSVLEAITAFESVTQQRLNYRIGPRRAGDVAAIYTDTRRTEQALGWKAEHSLNEMMAMAWAWEQHLLQEAKG